MAHTQIRQSITKGVAKVPVIMQMEAVECGAACLTMILAYYRKWIPLERVRSDCGVSRDGARASNIVSAAQYYGLKASGHKYEPYMLKKLGRFPCIVHWGFSRFVVLKGFRGSYAYINDPALGSLRVTMEEFDEAFTGVCLLMEPGEDFKPSGRPRSVFRFAQTRLRGAHAAVILTMLSAAILSAIGLISPVFKRIFTDRLLSGEDPEWFWPFIGALTALSLVQIIVESISALLSLKISGKFAVVGNAGYMWKILRMPVEFFTQRMDGDIISRKQTNSTIAKTFIDTLAPILVNAAMLVFYVAVMLRYSALLTLIGIVSVVINLAISYVITKKRINITRVLMSQRANLSSATLSGIRMVETIKAAGAESGFFQEWADFQAGANAESVNYENLDGSLLGLMPQLVSAAADVAVMMCGVWMIIQGHFTVGMIQAFLSLLSSFSKPAESLIGAGQTILEMRTDMERVEDVMRYPTDPLLGKDDMPERAKPGRRSAGAKAPDPEAVKTAHKADDSAAGAEKESKEPKKAAPAVRTDRTEYTKLTGEIELRHVTFGYSRLDKPIVEDINITIHSGSRIALVGASGCGKSTVIRLISGLIRPWSGEILYDGRSIDEIDRSEFTSSIAVVDQNIVMFHDTIAQNIRMWDETLDDFDVILAARDAGIHHDIMEREGGYSAIIADGGKDFSGGQTQRIEIARALAVDPTILIMDEATSALDAETEYEVVKAIWARGLTCIVAAHRLSTIRDCDEIIVLDHGRVVQRGTHEELYAQDGPYRDLVISD